MLGWVMIDGFANVPLQATQRAGHLLTPLSGIWPFQEKQEQLAANFALACPMGHQTVPGQLINQPPALPHHRVLSLAQYAFVMLVQPPTSRMSIPQLHVRAHLHLLQQGSIHHRQMPQGCILSSSPSCQQCSPLSTPCITPAATTVPASYVNL